VQSVEKKDSRKHGRREGFRRHSEPPSPRRPIVVTFTTEYKYGEIAEITGKLGKKFLRHVFSGLRGLEGVGRVDKKAGAREQGSENGRRVGRAGDFG
jgi:hypothetical protein